MNRGYAQASSSDDFFQPVTRPASLRAQENASTFQKRTGLDWRPAFRRTGSDTPTEYRPLRENRTASQNIEFVDMSEPSRSASSRHRPVKQSEGRVLRGVRPLKDWSFISSVFFAIEGVLALCPIIFLIVCALVAGLNGKTVEGNQLGHNVQQLILLSPTIFPIIFSAISARAMVALSHFKAEKGERLSVLEMLMASQTVWGTLQSQLRLRRISIIGIGRVLLWVLSPLGSQASFRLLDTVYETTSREGQIRYFDTGGFQNQQSIFGTSAAGPWMSAADSIYVSSLLSPNTILAGHQDNWGNLKIPRLEAFDNTKHDMYGWYTVPENITTDDFSSLVGMPLVGVNNMNATFIMEYSYLSLQCPKLLNVSIADKSWSTRLGQIWGNSNMSTGGPFDIPDSSCSSSSNVSVSFFLDTNLNLTDNARISAAAGLPLTRAEMHDPLLDDIRNILFGSRIPGYSGNIMIANCSLSQSHVEASVNCTQSSSCRVTKVRSSRDDIRAPFWTPLDYLVVTHNMFYKFPLATGSPAQSGVSSPTEYFMMNTSISPYRGLNSMAEEGYSNLFELPADVFAARLALVMNTYYTIGLGPSAFIGGLPNNLALYGPPVFNVTSSHDRTLALEVPMISRETTALFFDTQEIFKARWGWLAAFALCSAVLLLVGILGTVLKIRTHAPEMLGFVASMTYHNPYVKIPAGTPIPGMKRARALRDLRVQLADVRGDEPVGEVALIATDKGVYGNRTGSVASLRKHRSYASM